MHFMYRGFFPVGLLYMSFSLLQCLCDETSDEIRFYIFGADMEVSNVIYGCSLDRDEV